MDARDTQAFDNCLKEALTLTREWMPRWLTQLQTAIQDRESTTSQMGEKQGLITARHALETHRDAIATGFLASMAESVEQAMPRSGNGPRWPRPARPCSRWKKRSLRSPCATRASPSPT